MAGTASFPGFLERVLMPLFRPWAGVAVAMSATSQLDDQEVPVVVPVLGLPEPEQLDRATTVVRLLVAAVVAPVRRGPGRAEASVESPRSSTVRWPPSWVSVRFPPLVLTSLEVAQEATRRAAA